MKTRLSKRILALLLTLLMVLSLLPMSFAEEAPKSDDLVILFTNDIHCGVDQSDSSIGIAGLAKIKKDMEATHKNVALVDNGDAIQGELIGTVSKGEYMVQLMNFVGFDYAAFGNHEYDYTMPQLKKLVDMAKVKYLSCNFRYIGETPDENAVNLDGYTVVDYDGLKVGYVGITTPESLVKSTPTYFQDENGEWIYTFCNGGDGQELYDAVQTAVDAARADGAQVVVALAHLGIDEQSAPWRSTDVIANTTGIDVMLDGHSHSTIERQEVANKNGETVLLSSTGTKLAHVGKLTVTPEGAVNTELIKRSDVDGVDPETQAYLEQIEAEFEEMKQQVVAHVDYDLLTTHPETGKRMIRMRETNLGDVCADAYRTVLEADVAFVNGGGIRANIPAGDVTYEQIINVHPYSNMGCKVKTTGQQILDALEMSARNLNMNEAGELEGENGGFLHVSGLKFTINLAIPSSVVVDESKMFVEVAGERRVQDVKVLQNGKYVPIDPAGTYSLASHNYMLKDSGDGLNMFKNDELLLDEVKVDNQILIEYMSSEEFANHDYSNWEGEGRIRIVNFKGDELAGKTIILHTNDTHGALLGFAQVAQVRADLEAQGARVILVDAGDFSQGTTYVSTNKGAAAITMMNAAVYEVATLGNHEFDFGYAQLMQNLKKADFMTLCADVYKKGTEETILAPHTIVNLQDGSGLLRVGFFGMETPETQTKVNPGLITEIDFGTNENGKFLSAAQKAVAALKEKGADLVIGLVHLGVDPESEPYRSFDLYNAVEGIDFLIDGHSHTQMTPGVEQIGEDVNPCPELPIQSTGTKASATALMNVGMIQIDNATKTIEKTELIPLGADAPVDDEVAAVAREIMDTVDAEYGAKFAESLVDLNGDRAPGNRNMETNLGDLITDSMLWSVMKDMDAETLGVPQENVVAITNGGGIRAWIRKGDVTKNDVNTVLPFGNTVAVVYVTGAELLEALEASTHCTPTSLGGFPQISGMNITIDLKKSFDQGDLYPGSTYYQPASVRRVTINDVNGKAFDPEATYAVITNNFCAAGGDTYYAFHAATSQFDTGIPLDEALINFIMDPNGMNGVIGEHYAEPQGRITLKNGFDDVQDPSKYYYTPVYWAYDHEPQITGGKTDTLFGVKCPCTREQIVTFLWKAYGAEQPAATENPFTDVKEGKYYFKPVMWAKEKGITGGISDTLFGVGKPCKREQAVTFLWKAAGAPMPKSTENPFTDVKEGKYYYKAVLWALENGVTGGISADKFGVGKDCTREQIVTFLYAALEKEHKAEIRVFETTDIHGYLLDTSSGDESTFQYRMAYLANIFNEARASEDYDDVLLLDGGDIYQGTPVSNLLQGRAIRAALDKMGYDAVALGNHEFDWGVTNNADAEGTIPAYELGSFSGDPDIPVLAYNLYEAETGNPVPFTKDYTVVEKAGYRIALVGYIPNYRGDIMAAEINPYTIDEDLSKLAEKVHEINEAEKPDVTIILAHESPMGIAKAMDPAEVDLVAGGHSHSGRAGVAENGIPYLQGNCQAQGYASANLTITRKGAGEISVTVTDPLYTGITASSNRPNLYDTEDNADKLDPVILELSHLAWEEVKDEMEEVLGWIDVPITKSGKLSDNGATRAGNWISGLMLRGTAELHPVAAFYNSGGIRTSFNIPEGETTREITTGDIYTINPFGNSWLVYELTAPEIAQQLLNGFREPNYGDQMSGLTFTYWQEGSGRNAERGIVSITLNDGTKLDLNDNETTYRICTTNYSATLDGSVFQGKEPIVPMADAPVDNVTIIELLRADKAQGDGYISVDETGRGTKVEKPQEDVLELSFPSTSNDDIEKYGNIFTDLNAAEFFEAGYTWGDVVSVRFLDKDLELPVVPTYSYVDQGSAAVIVGKDGETGEPVGRVKMAINMGDFANAYGLATKTTNADKTYFWTANEGVEFPVPITIQMAEQGGYMAEMLLHDINRTNNRGDYPELTDAEFANFRQITTTGMGDHLYRGSSPINPEIGRNTYADAELQKAGVTVIMNLANDEAAAEAYPGFADTYYSKQNVVYLNLGVDFQAEDFKAGLANGLRHFAENQGVYYVHCTEGKDRAGFVSALLECLMGATYDEVVADYLKTYTNYYTVVDGQQQALSQETLDAIAQSNIIKTLQTAFGVEDLKTADLAAEAKAYVKELGLTDEEIAALKTNLSGETASTEAEFEFLITSDIHGQFFATDYTRPYAQSGTHNQGMTRISTYLKEQKAEYGDNAYIVDMGDTFQGAPLTYYYAFNKPEVEDPAIKTFRHIGYDMWIVGNHEFNYGLEILTRQMDYAVSPSTENEKQLTISMANYLKAESNNDETKDWATWRDVAPYVVKDFDGVKVAIIGFGNPNIPQWDVPANWEGIYFADIIDTYKHYEPEMLEQADMIVAVAHSGIGSDPDSDFMERLINATDSIAFAFSGHEHGSKVYEATNAKGETVPILQPGTKARYVAKVLVNYNKAEGSYEIAPELVDLRNYALDQELVDILQPYETDTWENYMLQPIGKALGDYPAANLGTAPSAFVDLINTVQLWGAYDRGGVNTPDDPSDDNPAMLSITAPLTAGNNANLISEGDIYLGDMFGLYRFENWFYQITMSGEEVHQWLEYSASKVVPNGSGGYNIQGGLTYYDIIYGEGFHYDFDVSKPAGERVVNMSYNGQPVTPDQEFTVVVNNYRYNGGGDYVKYLNEHGCSFTPNDPDRIIYSTQFDMIQGEDEGQARTLLTRYIQQETESKGGITPTILSDWRILDGSEEPETVYTASTALPENGKQYALIAQTADGKFYALDNFELEGSKELATATEVNVNSGTMSISELPETVLFDAVVDGGSIQFMVGANYLHLNNSKLRVTNGTTNSHLSFTKVAGTEDLYTVICTDNNSILTFNGERFSASNKAGTEPAQVYLFTVG